MNQQPGDRQGDRVVAAALEGDREAIDALWRLHRRWIAAVLLAHKPAMDDLDDLLQEVAMTMVAKIHTLREERNLRAWLRTVAVNVARASARSARSRPVTPSAELDSTPSPLRLHTGEMERDETTRIMELIAQLPENYREPLVLRALHGMRSRQIAEIMNIPEATVDTRVARARRMLLELSENGGATSAVDGAVSS